MSGYVLEYSQSPLPTSEVTGFRGLAARANYLSADRKDIKFAAKEVCRFMSSPTETSVAAMERLGRYIVGHKRLVWAYPNQRAEGVTSTAILIGPGVQEPGSRRVEEL